MLLFLFPIYDNLSVMCKVNTLFVIMIIIKLIYYIFQEAHFTLSMIIIELM
jgi:hypothetical protein